MIRRTLRVGFTLLLSACLLVNCTRKDEDRDPVFDQLYAEFQKNKHAEYDSLLGFYHRLDSVGKLEKLEKPVMLQFLKKTTEARLYFRESDYVKSNRKYLEANSLLRNQVGVDSFLALNHMGLGINYTHMATYDSAFQAFRKAQSMYEALGNKQMQHIVQANMAQMYYNKREPEKALEIIHQLKGDVVGHNTQLSLLHIKANIFGNAGKIDSAMALDRQVIGKYGDNKNDYQLSSFYNNLGLCYLSKGMMDSAVYYCLKSYEIDSLSGIKMNMGANLVLMGDIYRQCNQKKKASEYYEKALQIFSDDSNLEKRHWLYEILAEAAKQDKDLNKQVVYQDSILSVFGRMNSLNVNRSIELLNIEYETDKKNQQLKLQEAQLKSQRIYISLTVLISLLLLTVVYFYFQNKHKRHELLLAEQEKKVSIMLVEAEQNERSRIARDLHDSVSQKLAVMQMHLSVIETEQTDAVEKVTDMLQQAISDVRGISHNLYPKDLEKGIIAALEQLCEQNNFINHSVVFKLHTDDAIRRADLTKNIELVLYRIVQELTNNALKYSKASEVRIDLGIRDGKIALNVADNGVGFDSAHLDNAKGIGLKNMMDRIRQISGKVTIQSKETEGTQFHIEIPA